MEVEKVFFEEHLRKCQNISEKTSYIEILNYAVCVIPTTEVTAFRVCGSNKQSWLTARQDGHTTTPECHSLSDEDFHNFLKREVCCVDLAALECRTMS